MVAVPGPADVTSPVGETTAIDTSLDAQVACVVTLSVVPFAKWAVAVNWLV